MNHFLRLTLLTIACTQLFAASSQRLDINRLYSLPSVIGTSPQGFVWSPDSQTLAFLWNNEGRPFRDVWIVRRNNPQPVRVTAMPHPFADPSPGNDLQKLEQSAQAEIDEGITHIAWTSDGQCLLFPFEGRLYSVPLSGDKPELLVNEASVQFVKPAPSGNRLAFEAGSSLYLASVSGAHGKASGVRKIGNTPLHIEDLIWAPDGQTLAFIDADDKNVPERGIPNYLPDETVLRQVKRPFPGEPSVRRRIGLLRADGQTTVIHWAALDGDSMDPLFSIAWSPDSKTLLVDKSDLYIKHRRLLLVDAASGKASLLTREDDPKNVTAEWWADWAPDGRGIYFTSDREDFYQVYFVPISGGATHRITSGRGEILWAAISPHANALFYTSNEGQPEERHLHRLDLPSGASTQLTHTPGTHTPSISPDGQQAADFFSSDSIPPDLYLLPTRANSTAEQQITHSPRPEFAIYNWVAAKYVTFRSTTDGVTLHARLTLPPGFDRNKKYPAILGSVYSNTVHNQWGGRVAHPTWGLDQYLAQQGYVLLNVDVRGSSGYGKPFRQRLALDYGGIDVEDLYSGVKYLEHAGFVDMSRIGMWGSSYGGLLTTTSLFTHPGVYKAGVAGAPATSLFHALTGEMRTMMARQDHQREYARASAFLKAGVLRDHLLIIHGMQDQIVLFKDSVTLEQRLILQNRDVRLVPLPASPHSWDTGPLAQTRYAYAQLIAFFNEHLGSGPSPR